MSRTAPDTDDLRGFVAEVELAELAVATSSNILLRGIGVGLTMFARRIPTLIFSEFRDTPFRAPHHSVSSKQLINEARAARGGVLFLDELDSFRTSALRDLASELEEMTRRLHETAELGVLPHLPPPLIVASMTRPGSHTGKKARDIIGFPIEIDFPLLTLEEIGDLRATGTWPPSSSELRERIRSREPGVIEAARDAIIEGNIPLANEVYRRNPERASRGRSTARANPSRTKQQTIELFKQVLREPGVESIQIAQDLLEEQGLTLADASIEDTQEPEYDPRERLGRFELSGSQHIPGADSEDYNAVHWRAGPRLSHYSSATVNEATWWFYYKGKAFQDQRASVSAEHNLDEAVFRAVEHAWHLVKILKRIEFSSMSDEQVLRELAGTWPDQPLREMPPTDPWLISSFGSSHPGAPEHTRARRNPSVSPQAARMYRGFHQLEPKKVGGFHPDLVIPETCICVGDAIHVLYRSDKLNPTTGEDEGMIDYIHEHGRGVRIYRCDRNAEGQEVRVPAWIRNVSDLVKLGDCNGFAYKSLETGKKSEAKGSAPLPELYTTASGKCLLVIQGKRKLLALIWGGKLGVEPRGIVH